MSCVLFVTNSQCGTLYLKTSMAFRDSEAEDGLYSLVTGLPACCPEVDTGTCNIGQAASCITYSLVDPHDLPLGF
jgi:hypothetical protein